MCFHRSQESEDDDEEDEDEDEEDEEAFPSPGDLFDPGIEPMSPALLAFSLPLSHQGNLRVDCAAFKEGSCRVLLGQQNF